MCAVIKRGANQFVVGQVELGEVLESRHLEGQRSGDLVVLQPKDLQHGRCVDVCMGVVSLVTDARRMSAQEVRTWSFFRKGSETAR
jgi:hypothetical protein